MMGLIKLQGWATMWLLTIEEDGQPWLSESYISAKMWPGLPAYTPRNFLEEWVPLMEAKQ